MKAIPTGESSVEAGIYQSSCPCRTAITVTGAARLPRCMSCEQDVVWRLVQPVRVDSSPIHVAPSGPPRLTPTRDFRSPFDSVSDT